MPHDPSEPSIAIFVASGGSLFRESLVSVLDDEAGVVVVGEAASESAAVSEVIRTRPDVDAASGPRTPTNSRGRRATRNAGTAIEASVGAVFRSKAEKKVLEAGYDPARLPPGQYLTEKWPVLHAGSIPSTHLATWDFVVSGEVASPIRLSWDEFNRLPRTTHTQDIHCVTRWSRFDVTFEGVHWSALEPLVKPLGSARFVVAQAEEGYTANVPIEFLRDPLSLLATHADGVPLTPEHGGPHPPRHPRQVLLEERQVAARDRAHCRRSPRLLGAHGYHNDADPFKEERYGF